MIVIDFETRSRVNLKDCGQSVYARDASTEVLCLAYSMPEGVKLWTRGDPKPEDLFDLVCNGERIHAYNAGFERNIWEYVCRPMGWPAVAFNQWRCTMAACSRLTLPRGLDRTIRALGLPINKDKEGHKIMMQLCKPLGKNRKGAGEFDEDPHKHRRLGEYCIRDVEAEVALTEAIPPMTASELKVWQLDQTINERGIPVDRNALNNMKAIVETTYAEYCDQIKSLTNGVVDSPKQVSALGGWLKGVIGAKPKSLDKAAVAALLADPELPEIAREVLSVRQLAAMSSVGKLDAMLNRCDRDGRVRGSQIYHGAGTGRWSGAGIQIQNFPRGDLSEADVETIHEFLPHRDPRLLDLTIASPIDCASGALRSMIRSSVNKRLLVSDFAAIEARVLAWVSGQANLIKQFRAGEDVYVVMAAEIYGIDTEEVDSQQRFVGKTAILGLGFGMGHAAFKRACLTMAGVTIDRKLARRVVQTYRKLNNKIKEFWYALNTSAVRAIHLGQPHRVGRLSIDSDDTWMRIQLPSKRELFYREPTLIEVVAPWSEGHVGNVWAGEDKVEYLEDLDIDLGPFEGGVWTECDFPKGAALKLRRAGYKLDVEAKEPQMIKQVQYMSVNAMTHKWERTRTYGGKLTENVVQAIARDFLVEAMLRIERNGYPIIATVHDEIICERGNGHGSIEDFDAIMKQVPSWGRGCPINVKGFEARRYKK